jgi:hypothetical protein
MSMCVHAPCTWDNKCVRVCTLYVASTVRTNMCVHAPCTWDNKCVRVCTLYVAAKYTVQLVDG